MKIQYYKQEKGDTCGAACMRMALAAFDIKKSEREIEELMDLNDMPFHDDFAGVAERFKLCYIVKRNSTIAELKRILKEGWVIIICYFIPEAGVEHYSVLNGIDTDYVHFLDPYRGPDHKVPLAYFKKNWRTENNDEKGWFIAVKK